MTRHRVLTLLAASGVFAALFIGLIGAPQAAVAAFPLFGLVFLLLHWQREEEAPVLFLFLVSLLGFFLFTRLPYFVDILALLVEMIALWTALYALSLHRHREQHHAKDVQESLRRIETEIRDREREVQYYGRRRETMEHQARLRQGFAQAAQQLGSASDLEQTRLRLLELLKRDFPAGTSRLSMGQARDAVEEWAASRKASVLIEDLAGDRRFRHLAGAQFRSALVAPLLVLREPVGFVRVESPKEKAFDTSDLRAVDLLSTLAALSLENAQLFEQARNLAVHDGLTGLATHRAFQNRLQEELLRAARNRSRVAVVLCDIDHFKKVNDTYGHQAGDQVLRETAALIKQSAREIDFAARYGGEEFVLVMPECGVPEAAAAAEALRARVSARPVAAAGVQVPVTMSFGVSAFPDDAVTTSQLVRAADQRLYQAKHGGRNRVVAA